jgi:hypothetical protein
MIEVKPKVSENLYLFFFRYAKPIYIRFFFLWRTKSGVDWIYFGQNSKIHPSLHQAVSQLPTLPTCRSLLWSENTGWFLMKFFFNTDVTVSLLMNKTDAVYLRDSYRFSANPFHHNANNELFDNEPYFFAAKVISMTEISKHISDYL